MLHLLKVEWLKLKKFRPFWFIVALHPVAIAFTLAMAGKSYQVAAKQLPADQVFGSHPFKFPLAWQSASYASSFYHGIPALLILLVVCNEFQFKTHRQNLLDGWNRGQFFLSKFLMMLGLSALGVVWTVLGALIMGAIHESVPSLTGFQFVGYYALQALLYGSVALLFGFVFHRGMLAQAMFFFYSFLLERMLRASGGWLVKLAPSVGYLAPMASVDVLIPFPLTKQVSNMWAQHIPPPSVLVGAGLGWSALILVLSYTLFRRQDL